MSQEEVYRVLSDTPITQRQINDLLHIGTGQVSHYLKRLVKAGFVEVIATTQPRRPNGYVRKAKLPERQVSKWPKFEESC